MLQFFINGIFGADAYKRGSTKTTVLWALLEVKVPPCEPTRHGSLNVIKGNCSPVKTKQVQRAQSLWLYPYSTPTLEGCGWSATRPCRFSPEKIPGIRCRGRYVDLEPGLHVSGKPCPSEVQIPDPLVRSNLLFRVSLTRPQTKYVGYNK